MIDIVLGTAGCLATLPVAAVVKLSYLAADDTHPIFYKQTRVGLRGQCFELWKLRSMAWDDYCSAFATPFHAPLLQRSMADCHTLTI